jgi:hypothetical protein
MSRFGHNAKIICRKFAAEIGTPKEILDTPKENPKSPRVFSDTPKVTTLKGKKVKHFKQKELWH